MKIFRNLRNFTKPPKLSNISNYNLYWKTRRAGKKEYTKWSPFHRKVILSKILEDGKTLLDVGCGNCSFFDLLSEKKPHMKLKGIEFSEEACKIGRKKGYEVILKDLTKESLQEKYDYITILNVLEHIHYAEEILEKVKNNFRINLYISVPNVGYLGYRIRLGFFGRMPDTGCYYHIREHIRFWTYSDFINWVDF